MFGSILSPWVNIVLLVLPVLLTFWLHRPEVRRGLTSWIVHTHWQLSQGSRSAWPLSPTTKRCVLSIFVPNFLSPRATLRHAKEEDSCSQISPLKKYIKRTNHLAVWGMTKAEGGTLGLEVICGCSALFLGSSPVSSIAAKIVKNLNTWGY